MRGVEMHMWVWSLPHQHSACRCPTRLDIGDPFTSPFSDVPNAPPHCCCVSPCPLHQVSELRDAISCVADEVVGPSQGTAHRAYIFMEGTFYNDTRRPDAQDHVRPIVDLCRWEGRACVGRHARTFV